MTSFNLKIFPFLLYFIIKTGTEKANVCSDFMSYYSMDPKKCWFNPDVYKSAPDIILGHNYPLELHDVTTKDGYILTMFRLPKENRKGIIYLQAPFMSNCVVWIDKGNHSLAFMLWDDGYEVWLGNFRETAYGKRHKFLKTESREFWNFSFHENAVYDMPAEIELIVNVSQAKAKELTYVGLSMSGTTGIIYASLFPEESIKYFNLFVLMAPTAYTKNLVPLMYHLAVSTSNYHNIVYDYLGIYEFTGWVFVFNILSVCRNAPFMFLCMIVEMVVFGNVVEDQNPVGKRGCQPWIPLKFAHSPDSVPTKTMVHYGQMVNVQRFQMYDYGRKTNLDQYGSEKPPLYPVKNIKVPIYLVYSDADGLVSKKDVEILYDDLPEMSKIYGKRFVKHFAHISFLYGTYVKNLVYTPILEVINNVTIKRNND